MNTLLRFSIPLFFTTFTSFYACNPHESDPTCNDPIKEWPFPANASKWLFQPIKPGGTIKFKVYHRDNRGAPYVYRRDENFVIKDTTIKKISQTNIYTADNCNSRMIGDYFTTDIIGPEPLLCQLDDGVETGLLITLKNKLFKVGADQYLYTLDGWHDSLVIGGQKYFNVKNFAGVDIGSNYHYVDSTFCYYNLQFGIIKFIVNDTLIYQRSLH